MVDTPNAKDDVYQRLMKSNFMHHKEFHDLLHQKLAEFYQNKEFSMLDLGSGDAYFTAKALAQLPIKKYTAVDNSKKALDLAQQHLSAIDAEKNFISENLIQTVQNHASTYDVVFSCYIFHHFPTSEKLPLLKKLYRLLNPGGYLIIIDLFLQKHESIEAYFNKFFKALETNSALTTEEKKAMQNPSDNEGFPETYQQYEEWAQEIGFKHCHLVKHINGYAMLYCQC